MRNERISDYYDTDYITTTSCIEQIKYIVGYYEHGFIYVFDYDDLTRYY